VGLVVTAARIGAAGQKQFRRDFHPGGDRIEGSTLT
jgi:hypothetical protein